ncbi:MAG: DnaJ domain-containing protein [Clostridia bacterium]|nr:DnaJ domain-containing protein [Clostridia bacterium]
MTDPFGVLQLRPTTDIEEIRQAYHRLARLWHPDQFHTQEEQEEATRKMVALNQAYTECLKLASERGGAPYKENLTCEDALVLGQRLLAQNNPQSALRQLLRAASRNTEWYILHGDALMAMEQYESAEQSYREAIRLDPSRVDYRAKALDAVVAARKARTLTGRIKHLLHKK